MALLIMQPFNAQHPLIYVDRRRVETGKGPVFLYLLPSGDVVVFVDDDMPLDDKIQQQFEQALEELTAIGKH